MAPKHGQREYRQVKQGAPGVGAYLLLAVLMVALTIIRLCRKRRKFSKRQLEGFHDWKTGRAEGKLESKLASLKQKLDGMRARRKAEAGRDAHEKLLAKAEALRESRGKEVYGDDWDNPSDGVPIRDLFALSDPEVRSLQTEARNKQALASLETLAGGKPPAPKKPPPPPGPPPPSDAPARRPPAPRKPPPPPGPPPLDGPRRPRAEMPPGVAFVATPREAFGGGDDDRPRRPKSPRKKASSAAAAVRDALARPRQSPRSRKAATRKPPPPPGPPLPRGPAALPPLSGPPPRNPTSKRLERVAPAASLV